MIFIFSLSAQEASKSNELSLGLAGFILKHIEGILKSILNLELNQFNYFLRKSAHFFAYCILGVLVIRALFISRFYKKSLAIKAFLICLLYAISDEIHQLYVPGRSGELRDVMIDSIGAVVGILLYLLCIVNFRFIKNKNS